MRCEGSGQYCQNRNIGHSLKSFPVLRRCQHPATCQVLTDAALCRFLEFTVLVQCKLTSDKCEWVSYFSPERHVLPADFGASTGERNSTDFDVLQTYVANVDSIYFILSFLLQRLVEAFGLRCCTAAVVFIEVPVPSRTNLWGRNHVLSRDQ